MAWKKRKRMRPTAAVTTSSSTIHHVCDAIVPTSTDSGTTSSFAEKQVNSRESSDVIICSLDSHIRHDERRLRIVEPYPFTFVTYAKARWVGKALLDVFTEEFGSYPRVYYEVAITEGRISVNDNTVLPDYRIQGGDVIRHTVHRHEPAVLFYPKDKLIISETEDVVVVDKPPTLPVHPCGAYNLNSLFQILEEWHYGKPYTVHRLDRLTSGLTIVAKTPEVAKRLGKCISDRMSCEKIYLARVKGKFPMNFTSENRFQNCEGNGVPCHFGEKYPSASKASSDTAEAAIGFWISDQLGNPRDDVTLQQMSDIPCTLNDILMTPITTPQATGNQDYNKNKSTDSIGYYWLNLACPCRIAQPKNGVCEAGDFASQKGKEGAKPAQTSFALLQYDEQTDSSIVVAKPLTGRTHQIRLHLQYLGHPIANDPNYGGEMFYSNASGEQACLEATEKINSKEESKKRKKEHNSNSDEGRGSTAVENTALKIIADTPATEHEISSITSQQRKPDETLLEYITRTCVWCTRAGGNTAERAVLEFLVRSQGIWLHALQYKLDGVIYQTGIPQWCTFNK